MQHARAKIHQELGEQARPKEVADEGTRRWSEMTPADKSVSSLTYATVPGPLMFFVTGLG